MILLLFTIDLIFYWLLVVCGFSLDSSRCWVWSCCLSWEISFTSISLFWTSFWINSLSSALSFLSSSEHLKWLCMAGLRATKPQAVQVRLTCWHSCCQWTFRSSCAMPDLPQSVSGQAKEVYSLHSIRCALKSLYLNCLEHLLHSNNASFNIATSKGLMRGAGANGCRWQCGHGTFFFWPVQALMHTLQKKWLQLLHSTISFTTFEQIRQVNSAINFGSIALSGDKSAALLRSLMSVSIFADWYGCLLTVSALFADTVSAVCWLYQCCPLTVSVLSADCVSAVCWLC